MASVAKREWTHKGVTKTAWVVRYIDNDGAQRMKTVRSKKDADAYRKNIEAELDRGEHVASTRSVTVSRLIEEYVASLDARVASGRRMSRTTVITWAGMLRNHVEPSLGHRLLSEISRNQVEDWAKALHAKPISPRTAKDIVNTFKRAWGYGIRREYVLKDPVTQGTREYAGRPSPTIRTFTVDEVKAVLLAAADRRERGSRRTHAFMECAVYLATFCGLRLGEVLGLRVRDIDLLNRVVMVRRSLTRLGEHKGPKTAAGVRDVPMPLVLVEALQRWMPFVQANDMDLLFTTNEGTRFHPSAFHMNLWRPLLRRAGLAPPLEGTWLERRARKDNGYGQGKFVHFHALRHFWASMMIQNGVPLMEVAGLAGHSKFDMTLQVYAHQIVGGHRRGEAVESMAGALYSPPLMTRDAQQLTIP